MHSCLSRAGFLITKKHYHHLPAHPNEKTLVLIFKPVFLKLQATTTSKVPNSRRGATTLIGGVLFLSHS